MNIGQAKPGTKVKLNMSRIENSYDTHEMAEDLYQWALDNKDKIHTIAEREYNYDLVLLENCPYRYFAYELYIV